MNKVLALSFVMFACLCTGCGENWQAKTYPASGTVIVNGTPAGGAVVKLYPVSGKVDDRNSRPWAITDSNGAFQLKTYQAGDGAPLGEYDITVTWPVDLNDMQLAMVDQLDKQFSTPQKSQWKATIAEGDNVIAPIEISGVKLKSAKQASRRLPRGPEMDVKP